MTQFTHDHLRRFFQPRSIALIGASDKSAWSRLLFSRFAMFSHEGALYAVNRNGTPAHGLPAFETCREIPEPIDMAYVYVPAAAVADALRDAAAAGIRNAVILSSGFSDAGAEGARLEQEMKAVIAETGMTILGPNSLGFANIAHGSVCTSLPTRLPLRKGKLAVVSQSGALANEFSKFAHTQGIGLSFLCATGNEVQMGVADVLEYLVDDPETEAVALYVEGIDKPWRLMEAAERARKARKPVTILKIGRSEVSGAVAQAHTGSLVGDDKVFDAMCRRFGLCRVDSIEELIVTADVLGKIGPLDPPAISVVSLSGGACGLYADLAEKYGLAVPSMSDETAQKLREIMPDFATPMNPLDTTGAVLSDPDLWSRVIPILEAAPEFGLVVTVTSVPNTDLEVMALRAGIEAVVEGYRAAGKAPVLCAMTLQDQRENLATLRLELGLDIILPDLEFGVRALAHLQNWSHSVQAVHADAAAASKVTARPLGERETLAWLAKQGVPILPMTLARSADEAAAAAGQIDGALVLKISSPDIPHKTEAGGVRLNVAGSDEARRYYDEIVASARRYNPDATIEGVLVLPMVQAGVDLIVGVSRDPDWGLNLVVGLGGVFTELLRDSQVSLLPVSEDDVLEMLGKLAGSRILDGFRGSPPVDRRALARAIAKIAKAAQMLGGDLAAMEVNPLYARGDAVLCLDGLTFFSDGA
jgi:acyl-CoA synthetase (NDP forming)